MDAFNAIVLGIVQGLTEFLPVSSSGHLVIFQKLLGIEEHSLIFDVAVHLGTLGSVLTIYRKFIFESIKKSFVSLKEKRASEELTLMLMVLAGTIPTAIIGLSLKDLFESLFSNLTAVGVCLIITGFILLLTRGKGEKNSEGSFLKFSTNDLASLNLKKAIIIGVAQSVAIAPGISRSGITIAVAILLGLPRNVAAMFSFMLAIPAIAGAGVLQIKNISHLEGGMISALLVGFVIAYISGLAGLYGVLHLVKKGRLEFFTGYLWLLGALSLFWSFS